MKNISSAVLKTDLFRGEKAGQKPLAGNVIVIDSKISTSVKQWLCQIFRLLYLADFKGLLKLVQNLEMIYV